MHRADSALEHLNTVLEKCQAVAEVGGWEIDVLNNAVYWTPETYRIFETSPAEYSPSMKSAIQFFAPECVPTVTSAVRDAIQDGKPFSLELKLITAKGRKIWVKASSEIVRENGRTTKIYGAFQNITAHKGAERALKLERDFTKRILQTIGSLVIIMDLDSKIVQFNTACEVATGYAADEVIGKPFFEYFLIPEQKEAVKKVFSNLKAGQFPNQYENYLVAKTGVKRLISWSNTAMLDDKGEVQYVIGTGVDITERKQAENSLKESESELREAQRIGRFGSWIWHPATDEVTWSEECYAIMGLNPNLPAPNFSQEHTRFYTHESYTELTKAVQKTLETGTPYILELEAIYPNGGKHWITARGEAVRDSNGRITTFRGTIQDINEKRIAEQALRKSEERFRTYIEAMPQSAFIADSKGTLTYFNQRFYDYVGYKVKIGEWDSRTSSIVHPDDLERTTKAWSDSLLTGQPFSIVYRLRRRDGVYRWHLGRATPVRDNNGELQEWLGTNTDIHDQKTIEEKLESALRARDDFISIASHELKTPLSSLKLQGQIFMRAIKRGDPLIYLPQRINAMVEQYDRQIHRLVRLVDDMLDVSRIQSGKLTVEMKPACLNEIVSEVVERLRPQLDAAGASVHIEHQGQLDGVWDRNRIEQVVTNLLTNALKYGKQKPVHIKLEQMNGRAILSVRDQGIGIAKENQASHFQPIRTRDFSQRSERLGNGAFHCTRNCRITRRADLGRK